jgi:demethylmenaquinone methyltransferase/2-methoxy-6-polyprenyl-1,4-benzoquinol methylase
MFGAVAPTYDLLNRTLSLRVDTRWRRRAVRESLRPGDRRVLDLCCGTGDLALEYARRLEPGGQVIGLDFARPMLRLFQRKRERSAEAAVRPSALEADSLSLPFADAQFDVVSVAFGLRNIDGTLEGLREMTRVARPGGRVVVLEFSPPSRPRLAHRLFSLYFRHVLPRIGRLVSRHPTAYRYLPQSVEGFPSRERLVEMMGEAGLRVLLARDLTAGIATLFIGERS